MKKLISILVALALTGCVTLTEEQKYERENARIERSEKAQVAMRACERHGGMVHIERGYIGVTRLSSDSRDLGRDDRWECVR